MGVTLGDAEASATDRVSQELTRRQAIVLATLGLGMAAAPRALAAAEGQLVWGVHVSLAPTWFDPAETSGMITPFMLLYALHDAMVKPIPNNPLGPCLAESWTVSDDGLRYEFKLRTAKFHNGEPVTAEDVKYSFERYRGTSAAEMKARVASVEALDPQRVRFTLKATWPDFLTYYASATGSGWIVPKKYLEQVGEEGYKRAPVGAGPYKFVSFTPGVELVLEAFEEYWRSSPTVKRLVLRVIPDEATRLAALKRNEIDIAYSIRAELAEEMQRIPGVTLKPVVIQGTFWLYFPDQWDAKSPWHDPRVRQAASLAIDRTTINQALTLGFSKITGSIIPYSFSDYWQPPAPVYDAAKAKALLREAGHARGFDAGEYYCDASYSNIAEAVLNNLQEVGIRVKLRPLERAAFFKGYAEKKFKNLIQGASGAFGNAATRIETFVASGGAYSYGSYPDMDALFKEQAAEIDLKKRGEKLQRIQQLVHERTMYAPIWQLAFINGQGPRVGESALGKIEGHAYSAPYEDVRLKGKA